MWTKSWTLKKSMITPKHQLIASVIARKFNSIRHWLTSKISGISLFKIWKLRIIWKNMNMLEWARNRDRHCISTRPHSPIRQIDQLLTPLLGVTVPRKLGEIPNNYWAINHSVCWHVNAWKLNRLQVHYSVMKNFWESFYFKSNDDLMTESPL